MIKKKKSSKISSMGQSCPQYIVDALQVVMTGLHRASWVDGGPRRASAVWYRNNKKQAVMFKTRWLTKN